MSTQVRSHDAVLRILSSNVAALAGEVYLVPHGGATIGRADDRTVVIKDERVSRNHARVEATADGLRVVDLGSANGVWVDEKPVLEAVLRPGMRFRIAETVIEVQAPDPREGVIQEPGKD